MDLPPSPPAPPAQVPLATPRAARGWAAVLGATATFVAFGGVHQAWSATGGAATADRLLWALLGTLAAALVALLGAELLWSAVAPPPSLHLTEHHLTLRMPAVLARPLVVARTAMAGVRTVAGVGTTSRTRAAAGLVLLHGGALQVAHRREVLLLFAEPVALPVRTAAWLRTRALRRLSHPLPVPGTAVAGLRLPAGDATAAQWAALAAWAPADCGWLPVARSGRARLRAAAALVLPTAAVVVAAACVMA